MSDERFMSVGVATPSGPALRRSRWMLKHRGVPPGQAGYDAQFGFGRLSLAVLAVVVALVMFVLVSGAAYADTSQVDCASPFNAYGVSDAQLAACGIAKYPLSSTASLPGGGHLYTYDLADGQTTSIPQTPPGFDAVTASASMDAAYGVPQAPSVLSPAYSAWKKVAADWNMGGTPPSYVLVSPYKATDPSGPYWAGYINTGSGFTSAASDYNEPTLGSTSCSGAAAVIWSGIGGYGNGDLGQDGTAEGVGGLPDHTAWYEVLPGGIIGITVHGGPESGSNPYVTASPGQAVGAATYYTGSNNWEFVLAIGNSVYTRYATGNYNGSSAESIVERPSNGSGNVPLLNFQTVTINGGPNGNAISSYPYTVAQMTGFAATSGLSDGDTFTVTQQHCAG